MLLKIIDFMLFVLFGDNGQSQYRGSVLENDATIDENIINLIKLKTFIIKNSKKYF